MATQSDRDKIREATVSASKKPLSSIVNYGGVKVEIRQPTVKERHELTKRGMTDGEFDFLKYQIWGVILFSYVPNTKERVFEEGDFDALANQTSGAAADKLFEAWNTLSNVDIENEKKS